MTDAGTRQLLYARRLSLWIGLSLLVLAAVAGLWASSAFYTGYLCAFVLWSGLPLGGAAILMIHLLVGGRWGRALRPSMSAAAATIPLQAVLFIPVAWGLSVLYDWADPHVAMTELVHKQQAYLNVPFFLVRAGVLFVVWSVGSRWIYLRGLQDEGRSCAPRLAAAGLLIYGFSMSFAAVDWIGSLQPEWYSSILGLYVLVGQVLTALAILVLIAAFAGTRGSTLPADVLNDLANLMLTFVILHAYLAFSQFLIIWNGDLPREISWYTPRMDGIWGGVALLLIVLHFALPFALLLPRANKRRAVALRRIAAVVLLARFLDATWMVLPSYSGPILPVILLTLAATLGMGGVLACGFTWWWMRGPMIFAEPLKETTTR